MKKVDNSEARVECLNLGANATATVELKGLNEVLTGSRVSEVSSK